MFRDDVRLYFHLFWTIKLCPWQCPIAHHAVMYRCMWEELNLSKQLQNCKTFQKYHFRYHANFWLNLPTYLLIEPSYACRLLYFLYLLLEEILVLFLVICTHQNLKMMVKGLVCLQTGLPTVQVFQISGQQKMLLLME